MAPGTVLSETGAVRNTLAGFVFFVIAVLSASYSGVSGCARLEEVGPFDGKVFELRVADRVFGSADPRRRKYRIMFPIMILLAVITFVYTRRGWARRGDW